MPEHENLYDQVNAEIAHDYDPPPDDDKPTLAELQIANLVADHEYGNHPEPHWHRGCPLCEPRKPLAESES